MFPPHVRNRERWLDYHLRDFLTLTLDGMMSRLSVQHINISRKLWKVALEVYIRDDSVVGLYRGPRRPRGQRMSPIWSQIKHISVPTFFFLRRIHVQCPPASVGSQGRWILGMSRDPSTMYLATAYTRWLELELGLWFFFWDMYCYLLTSVA